MKKRIAYKIIESYTSRRHKGAAHKLTHNEGTFRLAIREWVAHERAAGREGYYNDRYTPRGR